MTSEDALFTAIEAIYDAALDERLWPQAMQRVMAVTDSQAATFCVIDDKASAGQPICPVFEYINFDDGFIAQYLAEVITLDPTVQAILSHPGQSVFHDSALISEADKDRHPYYAWHQQHSDTRHRLAGMTRPAPHLHSGLTIHRTRRRGDFESGHIQRYHLLQRHIDRALQTAFRLGTLASLHRLSTELLDHNPHAILLLDSAGRVVFANDAARALFTAADGLCLKLGVLELSRQTDNRLLQRLIARAIETHQRTGTHAGGAMQVLRPSGKRPYTLTLAPLPRHREDSGFGLTLFRPAACLTITDPEQQLALPHDLLNTLYGLSRAESRLAQRLACGEDLKTAANVLGVSYQTARAQLAAIFRKTGTRRQGELIRLLLTSSPIPLIYK